MQKLSFRATGWAAMVGWGFLNVMMLSHQAALGNSPLGEWHSAWLRTLYPGYQTFALPSILVALIEGLIWPWVFAWIFVTVYNRKVGV